MSIHLKAFAVLLPAVRLLAVAATQVLASSAISSNSTLLADLQVKSLRRATQHIQIK